MGFNCRETDAVNGFFEWGEFPRDGTVPVFNLSVVFKKGNVISCCFNTQHTLELVVYFD